MSNFPSAVYMYIILVVILEMEPIRIYCIDPYIIQDESVGRVEVWPWTVQQMSLTQ